MCVCHIPVALSVELLPHSTEVSEEIERAREREKRQQRLVALLGHSEWEEEEREREGERAGEGERESARTSKREREHVRSHVSRGEKSGPRMQSEGLEESGVCSVHEETGQGVHLRNRLQCLSQRHADRHVPSLSLSLSLEQV